jgi:hypothetical protein
MMPLSKPRLLPDGAMEKREAQGNWRTASKTDGVRQGHLRLDSGFAFSVVFRGSLILTSSLLLEHLR